MIRYKFDVLAALKQAGYSTYKIRKDNIIGQSTLTVLRSGGSLSFDTLDTLCKLLHCDVGDLLEYVPDE